MAAEVTFEELNVEELKVTSAVLTGAAFHYGNYCKDKNDAFMKCRYDKQDPRKCLTEGKQVTQCAKDFFSNIKDVCNESFTEHWTCLDYNNQDFPKCRKTQKIFDACMLNKLDLQRAKPN